MVLYRPRAENYYEAIRHLKLFDSTVDMNKYIIDYHNLYNFLIGPNKVSPLRGGDEEIQDTRSGWLHSRYIMLGNTPLGIFDSETLRCVPKPRLRIEEDYQNGLNCQFTLLDSTYIFFLGMDQWANTTQCTGYNIKDMQHKIFRKDNLAINRTTFLQLLHQFIADKAIKKIQADEKAAQLHKKKSVH